MPIVAKSEIARRTAAHAAAAAAPIGGQSSATPSAQSNPAASDAVSSEALHAASGDAEVPLPDSVAPPIPKPKQRRGHAVRGENGKYQPTADYLEGFARTPEHSRFKVGNKGGPGRPKGAASHDKLLAKHLSEKREVTIGGKRQKVANRELLIISTLKAALEGKDRHARAYVLAQTERIFRDQESAADAASAPALTASDALSIAEFEAELRAQLRAELMAERKHDSDRGDA